MNYKYILVISYKTISASKQVSTVPVIKTGTYEYNLNGPVKSAKEYTKLTDDKLSKEKNAFYTAAGYVDMFRGLSYTGFDRNQMRIFRYRLKGSFDSIYSDTLRSDSWKSRLYFYKESDYLQKKEYVKNKKVKSRYVFNPLEIKLNIVDERAYILKVEKDSSNLWSGRGYNYVFDESSKIIQENKFFYWDDDKDGVIDEKKMDYIANYSYNAKNQLINKEYEIISKTPIKVRIDHGLEIPSLRGTFVNEYVRVINELFFNNKGEVSKVIAYNNDETVFATRLYTYEGYDQYGNWTQCNKYLDGIITEKPTSITYRRFEYY